MKTASVPAASAILAFRLKKEWKESKGAYRFRA